MKNTTKTQLQKTIDSVNSRHRKGLNDDDQVVKMIQVANNCKGYTFQPEYDTYRIVTDGERLAFLVAKYGYWSQEVRDFNNVLTNKGGIDYMQQLNQKHTGTSNVK